MNYIDEKFADIQILRYKLEGFETLSLREKLYIYYLSKAVLSGRDITFDQFGKYNLAIRRVLEQIFMCYTGKRDTADFHALSQTCVVFKWHLSPLCVRQVCAWFHSGILL